MTDHDSLPQVRAERNLAHLENARGFLVLESDGHGPTLVRIQPMSEPSHWERVATGPTKKQHRFKQVSTAAPTKGAVMQEPNPLMPTGPDVVPTYLQPKNDPPKHPEHIVQFFNWTHLPAHLQEVSKPFSDMASRILATLPQNPERTVAPRKLLEAKDAAVRALLAK